MNFNQIPMFPAENFNYTRYLPTYEETIAPYSLRLPAYRSSYIHRFHPYARVTMSLFEERYNDNRDYGDTDEGALLDLSILDVSVSSNQETRVGEQSNEIPIVIVNPDVIIAQLNEQEDEQDDAEHARQPSPFLRIVRRLFSPVSPPSSLSRTRQSLDLKTIEKSAGVTSDRCP